MLRTSSLTLLQTDQILIKLTVQMINKNGENSVYTVFNSEGFEYMSIDPPAYIQMQIKGPKSLYTKEKVLRINQYEVYSLKRLLNNFSQLYKQPGLFKEYSSGFLEITDQNIIRRIHMATGSLELRPALHTPKNSPSVVQAGVKITINGEHEAIISSLEFNYLVDRINEINIQRDALAIINAAQISELYNIKMGKQYDIPQAQAPKNVKTHSSIYVAKDAVPDNEKEVTLDNRIKLSPVAQSFDEL